MSFLKKLFGGANTDAMQSGAQDAKETTDVTLDDIKAFQELASAQVSTKEALNQRFDMAARLMASGDFRESIAAYESIMGDFPEYTDDCEMQIGSAEFFLGNYEKAIWCYESAKQHGADPAVINEHIKEAREAAALSPA